MILATITHTQGSVPREVGTWMVVREHSIVGTLGGGHVEHQVIAYARQFKAGDGSSQHYALGPRLGQCCGGTMDVSFKPISEEQLLQLQVKQRSAYPPVALFGGGHVGQALVQALATLPFRVTWIDSRDEIFPPELPATVRCEHSDPVQDAVFSLEAGSFVVVMSFSHAEDLAIVQQCLRRQQSARDLPFIGLIGSKTKWATFQSRLRARGFTDPAFAHVTCPIGIAGIKGKEPAVIAASIAAQLLQATT